MKDLKKLTESDLKKKIDEQRKDLLNKRFNISGTGKRNSKESSKLKREIAQMLTELKSRQNK